MIELIKKNEDYKDELEFNYKDYLVSSVSINSDLDDFITGKIPQGFKSGVHILDNHFVSKKNEFYIVTGKKGQGKTTIYQILQLLFSISNNLIWVVAFQENSNWSMKLNLMNLILGGFARDVKQKNLSLYNKASKWIDKHFIFIEVESIKTATEVAEGLINDGVDVHGLLLDPINSFKNGWQDTGNGYADGVATSLKLLNFAKKVCSVHITQHPNMSGQRQEGAVSSYQAEGGWFLNKAHNTCAIHREPGSSQNELMVEHVRNKHTGGDQTERENPVIIEWSPTQINIFMKNTPNISENNVIKELVDKYNIFDLDIEDKKPTPTASLDEAFGDDEEVLF